jgi:hypothetical protein
MDTLSYLNVAVTVLESPKRPMTVREIVEEAVRSGLLQPVGKTPEATMTAALYTSVKDDSQTRRAQSSAIRR